MAILLHWPKFTIPITLSLDRTFDTVSVAS